MEEQLSRSKKSKTEISEGQTMGLIFRNKKLDVVIIFKLYYLFLAINKATSGIG